MKRGWTKKKYITHIHDATERRREKKMKKKKKKEKNMVGNQFSVISFDNILIL